MTNLDYKRTKREKMMDSKKFLHEFQSSG